MLPKFEDFLYPFLLSLREGRKTVSEVRNYLKNYFKLSDEDCSIFTKNGNTTKFVDRIGWSRQYFRRALFIDIPQRGIYKITKRGQDYLKKHNSLVINDLLAYPEFETYYNKSHKKAKESKEDDSNGSITPTEALENAYNDIESSLSSDLKTYIMSMSPSFFEKLVVDLLVAMGYGGDMEDAATVTQQTNDGGVDGIIKEDALGLDNIYIQAKRWNDKKKVGVHEIRDFGSALDEAKASKGVFITTSDFSSEAKKSASKQSKRLVLINGADLTRYMIKYNIGVSIKQSYIVKKVNTEYFNEDTE